MCNPRTRMYFQRCLFGTIPHSSTKTNKREPQKALLDVQIRGYSLEFRNVPEDIGYIMELIGLGQLVCNV